MKASPSQALFWHHQLIAPSYTVLAPYALDAAILDVGAGYVPGLTLLVQQGATQVTCISQHSQQLLQDCQAQGLDGIDLLTWPPTAHTLPAQSYDLMLINGMSLPSGQQASALLAHLLPALSPHGILLWTAIPPHAGKPLAALQPQVHPFSPMDAHSWHLWHEALGQAFPSVQWLGQLPCTGHLLYDCADYSQGDVLKLDRELLPEQEEQPSHLLAICSQEPLTLTEMTIVQLPFLPLVEHASTHVAQPTQDVTHHHEPALQQAQQQIRHLQAEIDVLKQQLAESHPPPSVMSASPHLPQPSPSPHGKAAAPGTGSLENHKQIPQTTQQVLQVLQQEAKEQDSQIRAALPDSADAMVQFLPQHGARSFVSPSTSMPAQDAMGRKLDAAVDELEDLLRDVSAPRGHK